jgi:hypothetical protein
MYVVCGGKGLGVLVKTPKKNLETLAKAGDCVVVINVNGLNPKIVHLVAHSEGPAAQNLGHTACLQQFFTQNWHGEPGEDALVPGPYHCLWCVLGQPWNT